jgi:DNA-binding NarL/FixJ family response regulator
MHNSKELAAALKAAGAKGYIIKSHAARDLVKAIRTIIDGGDFFFDPMPEKPDKVEGNSPLFCVGMAAAFA